MGPLQRYYDQIQHILEEKVQADPNANFSNGELCSYCSTMAPISDIFVEDIDNGKQATLLEGGYDYREFPFHQNLADWAESVAHGCILCNYMWESLSLGSETQTNTYFVAFESVDSQPARMNTSLRDSKPIDWNMPHPIIKKIPINCQETQPDLFENLVLRIGRLAKQGQEYGDDHILAGPKIGRTHYLCGISIDALTKRGTFKMERREAQLSLSTGSVPQLDLAKEWMKRCIETKQHRFCNGMYRSTESFPTRLLDLGSIDSGVIHLISSKDIGNTGPGRTPYVCLSHRWPKDPISTLTSEGEASLRQGFAISSLTQTFQDASCITRKLGYRYLWIDSLCIMQDSPSDWERESAIMGDIYRGSICTIALFLSASSNPRGFSVRNPLRCIPCRSVWHPIVHEDASKILGHSPSPHLTGELLTRGWVLQEITLSPRTIYYDHDEIKWECFENRACESMPDSINVVSLDPFQSSKGLFWQLVLMAQQITMRPNIPIQMIGSFHVLWSGLLTTYTSCSLTRITDKLVALNGIIRNIEKRTGMACVAGLWKERLPAELLWHTLNIRPASPESTAYRAPSWSWAALNVAIHNDFYGLSSIGKFEFEWFSTVTSIQVQSQPNGALLSASITVEAPMREEPMFKDHERKKAVLAAARGQEGTPKNRRTFKFYNSDNGDDADQNVFALLIGRGSCSPIEVEDGEAEIADNWKCDVGIVLEKIDQDQSYKRVGYFEEHYWHGDKWPTFAGERLSQRREIIII